MDTTAIIITVINGLLIPLIFWGMGALVKYLSTKTKNEKAKGYISLAGEAVKTAVADVAQGYVKDIKEMGKWDKNAEECARAVAFDKALKLISQGTYNGLTLLLDDAEAYIKSKIQQEVRIEKKE